MTTLGIGPEARRRLSPAALPRSWPTSFGGRSSTANFRRRPAAAPRGARRAVQRQPGVVAGSLANLETEGLVSVRRGNRGGAVVHAPAKASAAYMLGLLLQSDYVPLADLGTALQELDPMCAALAAKRPDRGKRWCPSSRNSTSPWPNTSRTAPASPRSAASSTMRSCAAAATTR
jgi:hypothetical protein